MKEKRILSLCVKPGEKPIAMYLENDLDSLQKAVSIGCDYQGLIETVDIAEGVTILCNEEGKLIGLEPNRRLGFDVICGVFYIVGFNDESEFCYLTYDDIEKYRKMFEAPDTFENFDPDSYLFAHFIPVD